MGFLIYKKSSAGQNIRYERVKPLKLSGPDGPIARHVKTLRGDAAASWKLHAAELLPLVNGTSENNQTVLFELGEGPANVCLYELTGIHGSSRDTATQLALDFIVVADQKVDGNALEFARCFDVPLAAKPKQLGETLALTGGPSGGDWKWGETAMSLGVTVVHAQFIPTPSADTVGQ